MRCYLSRARARVQHRPRDPPGWGRGGVLTPPSRVHACTRGFRASATRRPPTRANRANRADDANDADRANRANHSNRANLVGEPLPANVTNVIWVINVTACRRRPVTRSLQVGAWGRRSGVLSPRTTVQRCNGRRGRRPLGADNGSLRPLCLCGRISAGSQTPWSGRRCNFTRGIDRHGWLEPVPFCSNPLLAKSGPPVVFSSPWVPV
jgi:hypothetical protein